MSNTNNAAIRTQSHQGHVWKYLAQNYATVTGVILESVQNGIDAGATKVLVLIDKVKRTLCVCDNGTGAGREHVNTALRSIAATIKEKDKFGQFGIGLISPIAIARQFSFTSCPAPRFSDYTKYVFDTKKIVDSPEIDIPVVSVPDLRHDPAGKIWWRSRVEASGLTKERRPSHVVPAELATSIALKFGEAIRERKIDITIEMIDDQGCLTTTRVEALQWKGIMVAPFEASKPECGDVKAKLFIAQLQKGGRKGVVLFGSFDNPSRITGEQFVRCAKDILDPAVAKVIISGVFEGVVLCKKISLHPDRARFQDDDALFALCEVMETWYRTIGKSTFQQVSESSQNELLQEIGLQVMPLIEALAALPQFTEVMSGIKIGTIGSGHAKVPKRLIIGQDDSKSLSIEGGLGTERKDGDGDGGSDGDKPKERQTHRPAIVNGPRGKTRTEVEGSSTGLRLSHIEFDDFRIPFEFERKTGTLSVNTRHSFFGQCQRDKPSLKQYHAAVAGLALTLEIHRKKDGSIDPKLVEFTYAALETNVFTILNGKPLTG